jgi:hypothetical protein
LRRNLWIQFSSGDPHAGPLGVGGFSWPAATAADPEKNLKLEVQVEAEAEADNIDMDIETEAKARPRGLRPDED